MYKVRTWNRILVFHLSWLWIGGLLLGVAGCEAPEMDASTTEQATAGIVTVEIDFHGRGESKEFQISCSPDSTVFSILQQAEQAGEIKFVHSGAGETAFVRSIDDLENEQATGDNWTYLVNGELGDRSCGVFQAKTGDRILWRFGKYP